MNDIKITNDLLNKKNDGRFSRFELITWWDQMKMKKANVLIIGAGALGNEIIKNCCLLGIGQILVADMDTIENSNLSRSILYREKDNGKFKAHVACQAAKEIYPEIKSHAFIGNIVHDLGRGVYHWADVIIAGLDNREARVSINSHARYTKKTWIDGAIEVLDGVARVFTPDKDTACYECTMSEADWRILQNRQSCALMTRDQMLEGRVPTTPTTSSIIAGIQTQEAIKIIHNMDVIGGEGTNYHGLSGDIYKVSYKQKQDCMAHDQYSELIKLPKGIKDITLKELFAEAKMRLNGNISIDLSRDIIESLFCLACNEKEEIFKSLGAITEADGLCQKCQQMRSPNTLLSIEEEQLNEELTLHQLGIPAFDIVTARNEDKEISFLLDGDKSAALGELI